MAERGDLVFRTRQQHNTFLLLLIVHSGGGGGEQEAVDIEEKLRGEGNILHPSAQMCEKCTQVLEQRNVNVTLLWTVVIL